MDSCGGTAGLVDSAKWRFSQIFGRPPSLAGVAPGRVNLIGEHTDYNQGFVMPMALPLYTVVVGGPRTDGGAECRVASLNLGSRTPVSITKAGVPGAAPWSEYVRGVLSLFPRESPPFDAIIASSVPLGGGLSSSAALEVATFTFLEALTSAGDIPLMEKAQLCQKAEHEYAGVPCGIMDQYIATMAPEGCALLIDCKSLTSERLPLADPELVVVVTNSNVKHELKGTEYAERRQMCMEAATLMGKPSLRDVSESDLENWKDSLSPVMYQRAHHVVSEIARTLRAADALKAADFSTFGKLMTESHRSLRDDFQVSCVELDQLVAIAMETEGVYGSRMTGAGFGGCTVTICHVCAVEKLKNNVTENYQGNPTFYSCRAVGGCYAIPSL